MPNFTQMGHAGLQGWRTKVSNAVAGPASDRTRFDEDQIRAALGALFFVLAAKYVLTTASTAIRQMREG